MHDLKVWPDVVADGNKDTTTPGKTSGREDEMSRLAKVTNIIICCFVKHYVQILDSTSVMCSDIHLEEGSMQSN